MKVRIVDMYKFQENNAIYFGLDFNYSQEFNVYAIMQSHRKKYILIYLKQITTLGFYQLGDEFNIIDDEIDENWVFEKKYKGGYQICGGGVCYFQPIKYKNVYAP